MINARVLLIVGFALAAVAFAAVGALANFRDTRRGWVTLTTVVKSTVFFMLAAISVVALLIAYNKDLWSGSLLLFMLALALAFVRVLIAWLSNSHIERIRPRSSSNGGDDPAMREAHRR